MKRSRIISGALCAAVFTAAAECVCAADIDLGTRMPVNTIKVSEDPGSIEYSNVGTIWTEVPYVIENGICYFDTVDARLLRLENSGAYIESGFYTDDIGEDDGIEPLYRELDALLESAGLNSARTELKERYDAYAAELNDPMLTRYGELSMRQELKSYMKNLKDSEIIYKDDLDSARVYISRSIAESYSHSDAADSAAGSYLQSMLAPSSAQDSMWRDISMTKTEGGKKVLNSASLTSVYKRIYAMAMAYQCESSAYYNDPQMLSGIITALDNADKYYYNSTTEMYGNWWDFLIGVPARACKILSIVWDDLSVQQQERFADALEKFCDYDAYSGAEKKPNEEQAGANLVNISNYDYIMGVLTRNVSKIERATEKFYSVFDYKQELLGLDLNGSYSDGFYSDGSFLQHGVPYNGSYGREFFVGVIEMAESLGSTCWGFGDEEFDRINEWIDNGFIPFIFRGGIMDIVNGRAASRNNTDKQYGYQIGRSILHYAGIMTDEAKKREYIETVKYWFLNSSEVNGITWETNCDDYSKSLVNSPEYAAVDHTGLGRVYSYPNMDRAVYRHSESWSAAVAMYSSRIPSYELTNGENTKGWYTGSGALYLYNSDDGHFTKDYWLAADMYYIPGTTVDSTQRYSDGSASADSTNPHYQNGDAEGKSGMDFVGSMPFGSGGMAAMQLAQGTLPLNSGMTKSTLSANKSYFMLPQGVLCIGTAISGGNGLVYTCVENRAIDEGDFRLTVDGEDHTGITGEAVANPSLVSISGSCGNISYYFPEGGALTINRSDRTENAKGVNVNNSGSVSGTFFTLKLNHTSDVNQQDTSSYCYMLLPDMDESAAQEFASAPNVQILAKTESVHAVEYTEDGRTVTAAAFFAPGEFTDTSGRTISCDSQALVMMDSDGSIAVTDTTRKLDSIAVSIDGSETVFNTSAAFGRPVTNTY